MKWGDGVGIVTPSLAIDLLTKREKGHKDHLLKVEKVQQKETMMAR